MTSSFDIVIVGGGMVGASLGVALAPLGLKVALVEAVPHDAATQPSFDERTTALSNGSRPDCTIRLPGVKTAIVIDSKFPLESFALLRAASDGERKAAIARVRSDVLRHVKDIAGKYLIAGETQTPAIMFVPSESIYADLHEFCPETIREAQRAQVVVVSPNILMLAIVTVQTVMKDARMREQANLIQREVGMLLRDVKLFGERTEKLQKHFDQANGDIKDILTSAARIAGRAERIEKVELGAAESGTPQLAAGS